MSYTLRSKDHFPQNHSGLLLASGIAVEQNPCRVKNTFSRVSLQN